MFYVRALSCKSSEGFTKQNFKALALTRITYGSIAFGEKDVTPFDLIVDLQNNLVKYRNIYSISLLIIKNGCVDSKKRFPNIQNEKYKQPFNFNAGLKATDFEYLSIAINLTGNGATKGQLVSDGSLPCLNLVFQLF